MSCYFRYLKALFAEAGVTVTAANKKRLDQAIHKAVGVPYKRCMSARHPERGAGGPDCWSQVKLALQDASRRRSLVAAVKNAR